MFPAAWEAGDTPQKSPFADLILRRFRLPAPSGACLTLRSQREAPFLALNLFTILFDFPFNLIPP